MNGVSQSPGRATINTAGAAKCVNVPPTETLTNSRPSVAYFRRRPRIEVVELAAEQQRGDRHRGWLGDERAQQRPDRQDGDPPGRRGRRRPARATARSERFGELDDRPRRRQRHDHDDEQRLGVVDRLVE